MSYDEIAQEKLEEILTETARRRKIWERMQEAGQAAVAVFRQEAQSRGVETEWFNVVEVSVYSPERDKHYSFSLYTDHTTISEAQSSVYERIPDLLEAEPERFVEAAVTALISRLNEH